MCLRVICGSDLNRSCPSRQRSADRGTPASVRAQRLSGATSQYSGRVVFPYRCACVSLRLHVSFSGRRCFLTCFLRSAPASGAGMELGNISHGHVRVLRHQLVQQLRAQVKGCRALLHARVDQPSDSRLRWRDKCLVARTQLTHGRHLCCRSYGDLYWEFQYETSIVCLVFSLIRSLFGLAFSGVAFELRGFVKLSLNLQ